MFRMQVMRRAYVDDRGLAQVEHLFDRCVDGRALIDRCVLLTLAGIVVAKTGEHRTGLRTQNREMTAADIAAPHHCKPNRIHVSPLATILVRPPRTAPCTPHLAPRTSH